MNFFQKRKLRKDVKATIHHAVHVVNMRGDLLGEHATQMIKTLTIDLSETLKKRDYDRLTEKLHEVSAFLEKQMAMHPHHGGAFRENFEIIVVAVAVAMGLRAYFVQPFKIPTGSMQPTLYGITSDSAYTPGLMDKFPVKIVKFIVTGDWYSVRRAAASGRLGEGHGSNTDPSTVVFSIGGKKHNIPKDALHDGNGYANPAFSPLQIFNPGDVLWSGLTHRGDHLFVNKVIWNFRKPRRDEVMVFKTDGIPTLQPGTHYIKRMCGLPNEKIAILPPYLRINGQTVTNLPGISKVAKSKDGYNGYQLAGELNSTTLEWPLRGDEYFALGDNTRNSQDSRYWGPVPVRNLVGPAVFVYWPITRRWGLIR